MKYCHHFPALFLILVLVLVSTHATIITPQQHSQQVTIDLLQQQQQLFPTTIPEPLLLQPTTTTTTNTNTLHNQWIEPQVLAFIHPWSLSDPFLSIDCMIRTTLFLPTDTYSITIKPLNDEEHTPFSKVEITTFADSRQVGDMSAVTLNPIDTALRNRPIPIPPNVRLKTTEHWINFRFLEEKEHHDSLYQFTVVFTFTTTNTDTSQEVSRDATRQVSQRMSLADAIIFENFRIIGKDDDDDEDDDDDDDDKLVHFGNRSNPMNNSSSHNDDLTVLSLTEQLQQQEQQQSKQLQQLKKSHKPQKQQHHKFRATPTVKNRFKIAFLKTNYALRTLEIALHGNHYFGGDFSSCTLGNEPIDRAVEQDVAQNLTIYNTKMGQHWPIDVVLECPKAYIWANDVESFQRSSILTIAGQDVTRWQIASQYPSYGLSISPLYKNLPDYTVYWLTTAAIFVLSTGLSFIIVHCWNLDDKQIMVT